MHEFGVNISGMNAWLYISRNDSELDWLWISVELTQHFFGHDVWIYYQEIIGIS